MSNTPKKITKPILIIALILLLSTIAYAKPFTDAFTGGLIQINDFFTKEQYKAYATTIDFFFFALLFISVYMIGVRYAFKEVKKPEKVIAILLGLMTAFLLVLGGFSATILLPYIHWLLYLLLFMFYWWLLKGMKSKFWRFILALLLALLTIGLIQGLFGAFAPDTEGFFNSFGKSIGSIKFPELPGPPGVPDYVTDLFGAPTAAPTGPDLTTLPSTTTPIAEAPGKGWLPGGYSAWHSLWILPLLFGLGWAGLKLWRRTPRVPAPGELTIPEQIDGIIRKKRESITKISKTRDEKNRIIQAADQKIAVVSKLGELEPANLWEGLRSITDQNDPLKRLFDVEMQFVTELKKLKDVERDLLNKFTEWQQFLSQRGNVGDDLDFLNNLIREKGNTKKIKEIGIVWLIKICYDFEKRVDILRQNQINLLEEENIEQLVRGKFETVKDNEKKLDVYIAAENKLIVALSEKIETQINRLEELKRKIIAGPTPTAQQPIQPAVPVPAAQAPQLPQLTLKIRMPLPNSEHVIGNPIINLEAEADGPQSELVNSGAVPNISFRWYIEQRIGVPEAYPTQQIYIGRTGNSEPIWPDIFIPGDAVLFVYLFDNERQIAHNSIPIRLIQLPRMRVNLGGVVKRERNLLGNISKNLKGKIKAGSHDAKLILEIIKEAVKDLAYFEEGGVVKRMSSELQEKSKRINKKVRVVSKFLLLKLKGVRYMTKAGAELEILEEERLRALGEAAEGPVAEEGPVEEGSPFPSATSRPAIDAASIEKFGILIDSIKTQNTVQAYSTLEEIRKFIGIDQYTLLRFVITNARNRQILNLNREVVLTRLEQEKVRSQGQFFGHFIESLIDTIRNM